VEVMDIRDGAAEVPVNGEAPRSCPRLNPSKTDLDLHDVGKLHGIGISIRR